ncbi:MAG: hypothetical protein RSN88_10880 [Gordonibacter sp.]|uniref:hypothetical protein n=1 Tax=Gordonibacter sp. TaxID=1968902 RepID=UPI002FC98A27
MAEHKYAEALRWLADGKEIEVRWGSRPEWWQLSMRNEVVNDEIVQGRGHYQFRLKPRTVKIGCREVEAPVRELKKGETYFYMDYAHCKAEKTTFEGHKFDAECLATGRAFASREACQAAHDAIHALLRGEA